MLISELVLRILATRDDRGVTPVELASIVASDPRALSIPNHGLRSLYAGMSSMLTNSRKLIEACQPDHPEWRGKRVPYRITPAGQRFLAAMA